MRDNGNIRLNFSTESIGAITLPLGEINYNIMPIKNENGKNHQSSSRVSNATLFQNTFYPLLLFITAQKYFIFGNYVHNSINIQINY